MSANKLADPSKLRFFVIRCTFPSGEGAVVKRKKGYISFLKLENAIRCAKRLAAKKGNEGSRFYVTHILGGALTPTEPMMVSTL